MPGPKKLSMKTNKKINVIASKLKSLHWEMIDNKVDLLIHIEKSRNEIANYMHTLAQWAEDRRPQRSMGTRSCRRNVNY